MNIDMIEAAAARLRGHARVTPLLSSPFLDQIAGATGGESRPFVNLEELVSAITPRQRTETHERRWRLWDMSIVLILAGALLTIEWVWRKMAGLV